jgi:hypothetical protein
MALPDVLIFKGRGGLGRQQPTDDGISALITQGVAITGKLTLGTVYELRSLAAAEAIGITATATTFARTWRHISEYFRRSPGAVLLFMAVARTVPMADICDRTLAGGAKSLLSGANGRVKQLAIVLNPASSYVPVIAGGLDADVLAAIPKAQALAAEEFTEHRPVFVALAGHGLQADTTTATDLRTLGSELVSVVVGTDAVASTEPAIGTLLGTISAASVHENIGWVGKFNLAGDGAFVNAGLSNGKTVMQLLPGELAGLHDKGYVFAMQHAGADGFYWNDSNTCTSVASDYAYLENVRTINKAAIITRRALLPSLKGPLPLTATGELRAEIVGSLEAQVQTAIEAGMLRAGEISACDVYIDPTQNVASTSVLEINLALIAVATGRQLEATVGFTQSL